MHRNRFSFYFFFKFLLQEAATLLHGYLMSQEMKGKGMVHDDVLSWY